MTAYATPEVHLYIHQSVAIFKARVNMATITYPVRYLDYDTVTLGAFGDIVTDMTLLLGTTEGADDLGRTRVQFTATSTQIPLGRVSQGVEDGTLTVQDNAYITILDDWRVWARLPWQSPDGVDFKDSSIPVDLLTSEIPPVAVMGAGFAGYTSGGVITVTFNGASSYAVAEGATITDYLWDIADGTLTVGTLASASITATFPAGFRYVTLMVTDSNGLTMITRRPVLAVNAAADVTIPKFRVESHRLTQKGTEITFRIFDNLARTTYPDGTLIMFWWGAAASAGDRSHMKFIGWEQSSDAGSRATRTGLVRETVLQCVDVAGRLESLPGFPQALQREDDPEVDEQWSLMPDLDMHKCLYYILYWHSTTLGVADFFLPATLQDYDSMRLDTIPSTSTLYNQMDDMCGMVVPDHVFVCNPQGQLSVLEDWMLVDVGDRPTIAGILTEDDWSDLRFDYSRPPRVHVLTGGAIVCSTSWIMLGAVETLPLAFSKAPGTVFSQGTREEQDNEGLTLNQADLNTNTGHKYARFNARFGLARVKLPTPDDVWDYAPALLQRLQLNISAATAAQRGLPFTQVNFMVKSIDLRYNTDKTGTWIDPDLQIELETSGPAAITHVPDVTEDPSDYETPAPPPPTVPPSFAVGEEEVAAIGIDGYVYRTSDFQTPSGSGGPTWTRVDTTIADTIYSWVVDPFSPGYITGSGTVNGWIVNDTDIYRVTDLFGTVTATSVFTFDEPTVAADFHWRTIQASFGAFFPANNPWLVCVSYYGDAVGHAGTWATYSTDGGTTWSAEVQISSGNTTLDRFMPVGVYTSPKTPGLAYTVAYVTTGGGEAPRWVEWKQDGTEELRPASFSAGLTAFAESTGPVVQDNPWIAVCPPANTKRIEVLCEWSSTRFSNGGFGSDGTGFDYADHADIARVGDHNFVEPGSNATTSNSFSSEYSLTTYLTADWPTNREDVEVSLPVSPEGVRYRALTSADASSGFLRQATTTLSLTVTEIELDDGTTYGPTDVAAALFCTTDWGATWVEVTDFIDPGAGQGGTLHIPWPTNAGEQIAYYGHYDDATVDAFRLMHNDGATQTDISPTASAIDYGVFGGTFGVRTYDSDRQYMALGGYGNDTSSSPADDKAGLWVSSNAGAAWAEILAPVAAAANAPRGLQIAFSGTDPDVLFAWGGKSDGSIASIYYSSNFGTTLDSREGNMNSLGVTTIIGIAGGATG